MKKYVATFKLFGKKYGIIRGGNLHAIGVLAGMLITAVLGYATVCMWVGLGNML